MKVPIIIISILIPIMFVMLIPTNQSNINLDGYQISCNGGTVYRMPQSPVINDDMYQFIDAKGIYRTHSVNHCSIPIEVSSIGIQNR